MELSVFVEDKEKAIDNAVQQASVLFNTFQFRVISEDTTEIKVPDHKRIRGIITSLIESAEKSFEKSTDKASPVRVSSARMSVTIWPFENDKSYMIDFDLGEWMDNE